MEKRLVAAIACRNQGARLYGKPIQNLDVENGVRILDNIIGCLKTLSFIDEIVLGISEGIENEIFKSIAESKGIRFIIGDQIDVLGRLIQCGKVAGATDIFRVTSESPFLYYQPVEALWLNHVKKNLDVTFFDNIIDGCGFEIISLAALETSHKNGQAKHRSELCSLYIRENRSKFVIENAAPPKDLIRSDLRLTVDNPEDLAVCRTLYNAFKNDAPRFDIHKLVNFLDQNSKLKELVAPFTEAGYSLMYR
jgi:spore coat polysaccharide biosynthesis protein SpsF